MTMSIMRVRSLPNLRQISSTPVVMADFIRAPSEEARRVGLASYLFAVQRVAGNCGLRGERVAPAGSPPGTQAAGRIPGRCNGEATAWNSSARQDPRVRAASRQVSATT
jgi:hypothetical protein